MNAAQVVGIEIIDASKKIDINTLFTYIIDQKTARDSA